MSGNRFPDQDQVEFGAFPQEQAGPWHDPYGTAEGGWDGRPEFVGTPEPESLSPEDWFDEEDPVDSRYGDNWLPRTDDETNVPSSPYLGDPDAGPRTWGDHEAPFEQPHADEWPTVASGSDRSMRRPDPAGRGPDPITADQNDFQHGLHRQDRGGETFGERSAPAAGSYDRALQTGRRNTATRAYAEHGSTGAGVGDVAPAGTVQTRAGRTGTRQTDVGQTEAAPASTNQTSAAQINAAQISAARISAARIRTATGIETAAGTDPGPGSDPAAEFDPATGFTTGFTTGAGTGADPAAGSSAAPSETFPGANAFTRAVAAALRSGDAPPTDTGTGHPEGRAHGNNAAQGIRRAEGIRNPAGGSEVSSSSSTGTPRPGNRTRTAPAPHRNGPAAPVRTPAPVPAPRLSSSLASALASLAPPRAPAGRATRIPTTTPRPRQHQPRQSQNAPEQTQPTPPKPPESRRPAAAARGFAPNADRVGTAREVMTYLARRPWLQLDVVDIILGTQFDRDDVAHALMVLQQTGRIRSHLRGDRVCYSYAVI
ncbi:hypothetical protein KIH74_24720 [Kineosporia sp. J2-2]|uniref:Uncharacterized protein n=1 Tax=Kineosporia corallincola TaxID=2835133 RepID=A0ABS5TM46_9ACTN|nr:hypothetical protein [Kineosporia corallincola]MBT0772171.1 hypothetical protein [Kineosporia corallincola]